MIDFTLLEDPLPHTIGDSVEEFLHNLDGPSCIILNGEDNSRSRAFVTLLHGNEPSGTMAIFRWIKSNRKPKVRIICIIASVHTAIQPPLFYYRTLPGEQDLNRCFKPPFTGQSGAIAEKLLSLLHEYSPEAVLDMHNTSGCGPAFGVATHYDKNHAALVSLFSKKLVITHLTLGALMDISEHYYPTVTIEAGGRLDTKAHEQAWTGMVSFFCEEDILKKNQQDWDIEVLSEPVRIEVKEGVSIGYAKSVNNEFTITLKEEIEYLNFQTITPDQHLGWVSRGGLDNFIVQDSRHQSIPEDWLTIRNHKLYPAKKLTFFMITNNPVIAIDDCLFYGVFA